MGGGVSIDTEGVDRVGTGEEVCGVVMPAFFSACSSTPFASLGEAVLFLARRRCSLHRHPKENKDKDGMPQPGVDLPSQYTDSTWFTDIPRRSQSCLCRGLR